jgi:transposase InsO family protein
VTTPARRREVVRAVRAVRAKLPGVSERRACRALGQPRSTQRLVARERNGERALCERMRELALRHPRYGYRRVGAVLRGEGFTVNHKRARRLWVQEGLKVPQKQRKRRRLPGAGGGGDNACHRRRAERADHVWSFDFCFDRTSDGRALKVFSVVDEFTRRCLAIEARRRITGGDVVSVLGALSRSNGGRGPEHVRCDNGPEFACAALKAWSARSGVSGLYVEPGSPWENGVVESYHARLRDELLDREAFATVAEARGLLEAWRHAYNNERPHGSLGYKTPAAFAAELAAASAARVAVPDPAPRYAAQGPARRR